MVTYKPDDKVVGDPTTGVGKKKGEEKLPEEEKEDEAAELVGGETVEEGEDRREGEVEGGEGGDGPGGGGEGGIQVWVGIPHVGHGEGKEPPGTLQL